MRATSGCRSARKPRKLDSEWTVAMQPGQRRKSEPNNPRSSGRKDKTSIWAKVKRPFLDAKQLFGHAKSLPPEPHRGTLPEPGQEH